MVSDAPVVRVSPQNITVNESMDVLIFCTYDANPPTLTSVQWLVPSVDYPHLIVTRAQQIVTKAQGSRAAHSAGGRGRGVA